jgi:hypothetical protein
LANYELVEGEAGDPYDTLIYDRNDLDQFGKPKLISFAAKGITKAMIYISNTVNFGTPVKSIVPTLPNDYTVRWSVIPADIPPAGDYYVQIKLFNNTGDLVRKTWEPLTLKVKPALGP